MQFNTLKTTLGFIFSWADTKLPISLRRSSVASIYNLVNIEGLVRTSGQPSEKQLISLSKKGVKTVLNLAPHKTENALRNEAASVTQLGMQYIHLPVNFKRPSEDDFAQFCEVMKESDRSELWIHCAANMRVSAFMYRYRVSVLNESAEIAKVDLGKIWEPFGVWRKFIHKGPPSDQS